MELIENIWICEIETAIRSACNYSPRTKFLIFRTYYYKFLLCLSTLEPSKIHSLQLHNKLYRTCVIKEVNQTIDL